VSQENVETVEAVYANWSQGEFRTLSHFDPQAVLVLHSPLPDAGDYPGVEAIKKYTRDFLEPWSELTISADEITEAGDRVLVSVIQRGVGGGSGIATELRYFHVWSLRDGRVVRLESIQDEAQAHEAAGVA